MTCACGSGQVLSFFHCLLFSHHLCLGKTSTISEQNTTASLTKQERQALANSVVDGATQLLPLVKMVVREPGELGGVDSDSVAYLPWVNGSSESATIK